MPTIEFQRTKFDSQGKNQLPEVETQQIDSQTQTLEAQTRFMRVRNGLRDA